MVFERKGGGLGVGTNKTVGIMKQRTGQQTGGVERRSVGELLSSLYKSNFVPTTELDRLCRLKVDQGERYVGPRYGCHVAVPGDAQRPMRT